MDDFCGRDVLCHVNPYCFSQQKWGHAVPCVYGLDCRASWFLDHFLQQCGQHPPEWPQNICKWSPATTHNNRIRPTKSATHNQVFNNVMLTYLIHPVWIENPEATQLPSSSLLGNRPLAALKFQLSNTLVGGLTINNTFWNWSLPATPSYTNTVNHITLECYKIIIKIKIQMKQGANTLPGLAQLIVMDKGISKVQLNHALLTRFLPVTGANLIKRKLAWSNDVQLILLWLVSGSIQSFVHMQFPKDKIHMPL